MGVIFEGVTDLTPDYNTACTTNLKFQQKGTWGEEMRRVQDNEVERRELGVPTS
jgi:hypothetical protein